MRLDLLLEIWPVLVLMIGAMTLGILHVLASQRRNALEVHDRVRKSQEIRRQYLETRDKREISV